MLAEELWPVAEVEQEARLEDDPWLDRLANINSTNLEFIGGYVRVASSVLLTNVLEMSVERQKQHHLKRLAGVMRKLGWEGPQLVKFKDGRTVRGYQRREREEDDEIGPPPW